MDHRIRSRNIDLIIDLPTRLPDMGWLIRFTHNGIPYRRVLREPEWLQASQPGMLTEEVIATIGIDPFPVGPG